MFSLVNYNLNHVSLYRTILGIYRESPLCIYFAIFKAYMYIMSVYNYTHYNYVTKKLLLLLLLLREASYTLARMELDAELVG